MIKVFLVEDEVIVRESIKKNIDWEKHGFSFVGESSDGELAYPMIKELRPDIVITDIQMPFMNGLELSRIILNELPNTKIIILSGYDEFNYAKEAIHLGVVDYLLKPMSSGLLLETVMRVGNMIEKEQTHQSNILIYQEEMKEKLWLERQLFFDDLISHKYTITDLMEKGERLSLSLNAKNYNVMLLKIYDSDKEEDNYSDNLMQPIAYLRTLVQMEREILMFERGMERIIFLLKGRDADHLKALEQEIIHKLTEAIHQELGMDYFISLGERVNRLSECKNSYENASKAFSFRYLLGRNKVIYQEDLDGYQLIYDKDFQLDMSDVMKIDRRLVEAFLQSGTHQEVHHFIEEFFQNIGTKNMESLMFRQYIVVDICVCAMAMLEGFGESREIYQEKTEGLKRLGSDITTIESSEELIENLLHEVIAIRDQCSRNKYNRLLIDAKDYINQNYMIDEISLNTVAAYVNLSPSYFSNIFSQEMGYTFIEYLTGVRMKKAKELLRFSDMKTSEIGYQVGYKDPHYFSYLFRKTQNCTPKEYRTNGGDVR